MLSPCSLGASAEEYKREMTGRLLGDGEGSVVLSVHNTHTGECTCFYRSTHDTHACIHIHTSQIQNTRAHPHSSLHTHTYSYTHTHTFRHTNTQAYAHSHILTFRHTHSHTKCAHIHTYTYMLTCTVIHTCTQMSTESL